MNIGRVTQESPGSNMMAQRGIEIVGTLICGENHNFIKFAIAEPLNGLIQARQFDDPVPLLNQSRHPKSDHLVELEKQHTDQEKHNQLSNPSETYMCCFPWF